MVNEILVINKDRYIDSSTKFEIEYAIKTSKQVNYMENKVCIIALTPHQVRFSWTRRNMGTTEFFIIIKYYIKLCIKYIVMLCR